MYSSEHGTLSAVYTCIVVSAVYEMECLYNS